MVKIEIKRKLVEEALDQLKAAQQDCYVESTQNVIDELELALRQPAVMPPLPSVQELREISKDRPNTFMNGALYIIDLIE